MTQDELKTVLELHTQWLLDNTKGARANLTGADLADANLTRANLTDAILTGVNLTRANLTGVNLTGAGLTYADLTYANLTRANLTGANLTDAILTGVNLTRANLTGAILTDADLTGVNLTGAKLPHFSLVTDGDMIVWKKLRAGVVAKLLVPAEARRTSSLIGRKCRAEYVKVLELFGLTSGDFPKGVSLWQTPAHSAYLPGTTYKVGEITRADSYDDDIRVECSHGIHFFITRQEAEKWNG